MPDEETHSMLAVVTTGIGDYDKLVINEVPIPILAQGEVLLKVLAAGVNNTDINTRLGWYSSSVSTGTKEAAFPSPESKNTVAGMEQLHFRSYKALIAVAELSRWPTAQMQQ